MTSIPANSPDFHPNVNPWFIRLPLLFLSGVILLVLVLSALVGVFQYYYHDKIVPGVTAMGLDLNGMTTEAARLALEDQFVYDDTAVFTFRDGDDFWQLSAGELGLSFDSQATAVEAFAVGHSGNIIVDMIDHLFIWLNGKDIAPIIHFDQNVAVEKLKSVAETLNRPAVDATLRINGMNVVTTPSQVGRTVNILATLSRLDETILNLGTGAEVPLIISETPPRIWDAEAAARKARAALAGPLVLIADSAEGETIGPWTANVNQVARLLKPVFVENADGSINYDIELNLHVFSDYLETLAPGLLQTPQDARYNFNENTGQLEVIQPAINGRKLDVAATLGRMEDTIFSANNRTVMMAFEYTLPRYHNDVTAAELGITELVSQGTTSFSGSTAPRRQNIAVAAARYNGVLIPPGGRFSFNEYAGNIKPEEGYVNAGVIIGDRTEQGIGGGICQVSTTVYQAAFYGGYPMGELYNHAYRVHYYEQGEGTGMDASVYIPTMDFTFTNDTEYHLLIETSVFPANDVVQFRFYSTNPGRQVIKEGPVIRHETEPLPTRYVANPDIPLGQGRQIDWAMPGADVAVTRVILNREGDVIDRWTRNAHYLPWGAVVEVHPDDPRLTS